MNQVNYIQNYALFFENLTSKTSKENYLKIFSKNVYFEDPFQKVRGIENVCKIFDHMFENLDEPRFIVKEIISNNNIAYIQWSFMYKYKNGKQVNSFTGVSRVEFDEEQKVVSHIDYWDSSTNVFEKIPVLRSIIKYIKNKIKA